MRRARERIRRKFDPVLKNIFANSLRAIFTLVGIPAEEVERIKFLPTEIHITKTLRLDLLVETPHYIIHIEIQNFPDPLLPRRMFVYYVSKELLKYIEEIEILSTLFDLRLEVKDMIKGEIDIAKTSLFKVRVIKIEGTEGIKKLGVIYKKVPKSESWRELLSYHFFLLFILSGFCRVFVGFARL